jgi:hypothetical protein
MGETVFVEQVAERFLELRIPFVSDFKDSILDSECIGMINSQFVITDLRSPTL